ncbi:MAG: hypothetical protein QNI90_12260 [Dinoroseobacter sp.]|nr:hypothetical protein [Dinoroseobacter sp.]
MKDRELELIIEELEQRHDLSPADYDGVAHALQFILPEALAQEPELAAKAATTDGALHLIACAYPNWAVELEGTAAEERGNWRCSLRDGGMADNDAAIGIGHGPVLSQAILSAIFRLTATLKKL